MSKEVTFRKPCGGTYIRPEWLECLGKYGIKPDDTVSVSEELYVDLLKEYGLYDLKESICDLINLFTERGYKTQNYKWIYEHLSREFDRITRIVSISNIEDWLCGGETLPERMMTEKAYSSCLSYSMYKFINNMISRNKLIKELFELNKDLDNKNLMMQVKFALNSCDPIFYPAVKIRPTKVTLPKLNIEFPDGVLERKMFKYEKER